MSAFYIILLTLIVYSLVATIVFIITKENEDVAIVFGLGVVGLVLVGVSKVIHKIINKFKYHIGKRSIFIEESTGKKYKCKVKDSQDIGWVSGYKIVRRYAEKSEWRDIPDFSKEFISNSKINCDNCKYDNECDQFPYYKVKCKHDEYGRVLEFDKFECKNKR